jgi:hypothetical protein
MHILHYWMMIGLHHMVWRGLGQSIDLKIRSERLWRSMMEHIECKDCHREGSPSRRPDVDTVLGMATSFEGPGSDSASPHHLGSK